MNLNVYFKSVLEQDTAAVVLCNLEHEIIYMNPAAKARYAKHSGGNLVGKSLLNCHNPKSNEKIEKFKRLNITIKIKAPLIFIRNVKVESDELYKLLEEDKRIKVLSDGQVNDKKINTYTAYIYLNNIDIKELKKIIGDFNYTITWKNIWNNRSYEKFYIKDYIR